MRTLGLNFHALIIFLAAATGCSSSAKDSETTENTSESDCLLGLPYCLCFEGMCFGDLICNEDDRCVPGFIPPDETGDGDGDGDTGAGDGDSSCIDHADCDVGDLCEGTGECASAFGRSYSLSRTDEHILCADGLGSCELLYYYYGWDGASWEKIDRLNFEAPDPSVWIGLHVWENDLFNDDFIETFHFSMLPAIEAWKRGESLRVHGGEAQDSSDWIEFQLELL